MKIKFLGAILGIAFLAIATSASAQKAYTQGTISLNADMRGQAVDAKIYFTPDSSAYTFTAGPANIRILSNAKRTYFAVIVDVAVASIKKAAIANPDEVEQAMAGLPKFTFAATTEAKQISGFNCKKVVATDTKTKTNYDVWITNDVTLPASVIPDYYSTIGGVPIQYTSFSQGQTSNVTVTGITDAKPPVGSFAIPADFDKITLDDLKAMSGGR